MNYTPYKIERLQKRYIILLSTIWAAILLALFIWIISHEIEELRSDYIATDMALQRYASDAVKVNEVAIESFASFIAAYTGPNPKIIRTFARQLLDHYPDIYMLEIATRIPHDEREKLRNEMRLLGYKNFTIHTFSYEKDRTSRISPEKESYYPIVFIEPEIKGAMGVLGLDLSDSSSILKDALARSFHQQNYVASRPFELMEGERGYLLYREVRNENTAIPFLELSPGNTRYALLLFRASKLLPKWVQDRSGWDISLDYPGAGKDANLVEVNNIHVKESSWENAFLPVFSNTSFLGSSSQRFVLTTRHPVLWSELDLSLIVTFTLVAAILSPLGIWVSQTIYRKKLRDIQEHERHYHLANYDPLTGLPNRTLAEELLEQSKKLRERHQKPLGVLFIDLDKFKAINDMHGHAAGDLLLKEVARRMRNALRESDTLARLHGDEFVVFLNEIDTPQDINIVIHHLKEAFKPAFVYQGHTLNVGLSIGCALYPEDGNTFEALLAKADRSMYRDKRSPGSATVTPIR